MAGGNYFAGYLGDSYISEISSIFGHHVGQRNCCFQCFNVLSPWLCRVMFAFSYCFHIASFFFFSDQCSHITSFLIPICLFISPDFGVLVQIMLTFWSNKVPSGFVCCSVSNPPSHFLCFQNFIPCKPFIASPFRIGPGAWTHADVDIYYNLLHYNL